MKEPLWLITRIQRASSVSKLLRGGNNEGVSETLREGVGAVVSGTGFDFTVQRCFSFIYLLSEVEGQEAGNSY